ncbi:MAG: cyoA [Herbaspirillum sp.]|jgi:cytochrome o ubiquinol oxidase subunit 2|nr:cyoA [Herbaspirillum sp.]
MRLRLLKTSIVILGAGLSGCTEGVLVTHGPIGASEKVLLLEALITMLVVVVPVILLALAYFWWFRSTNKRAVYRPDWEYSGRIEFSIWMVPLLIVLFLSAIAWTGAHDLDPYQPIESKQKPLNIQVVSMDWKWLFIYPDLGIASVNELAVPVGVPLNFKLTSATVMNSFFIPSVGGQIYTMAGMQTSLALQVADAGTYEGLSAQFSGDGFSDMHFPVLATDQAGFEAWVAKVKGGGGSLDESGYTRLANAHMTSGIEHFASVDNDIFGYATRQSVASAAVNLEYRSKTAMTKDGIIPGMEH